MKNLMILSCLLFASNVFAIPTLTVFGTLFNVDDSQDVTTDPEKVADVSVDNSDSRNRIAHLVGGRFLGSVTHRIFKSDGTLAIEDRGFPGGGNGSITMVPSATCGLDVIIPTAQIFFNVCNAEYGTAGLSAARIEMEYHGKTQDARFRILKSVGNVNTTDTALDANGNGVWKVIIPFKVDP